MRRARSGFTLVEILVVLVALVTLAAAVVPVLRGAGRQGNLEAIAARVAASARFARATAASRGVTVALTVETDPEMIRLAVEEDPDGQTPSGISTSRRPAQPGAATSAASVPLSERFAHVRLPAGMTAHLEPSPDAPSDPSPVADENALRFPPDGPARGGVIVLNDARGREYRVRVTPGTAQVVMEGDGE